MTSDRNRRLPFCNVEIGILRGNFGNVAIIWGSKRH